MTYPGMFPYAAAKSGLVGLTRSLALEVGPDGIRVNALSPGYVETALVAEFFAQKDPGLREKVLAAHPLGRMATPADIAACAVFLLSDEAALVTGRTGGSTGASARDSPVETPRPVTVRRPSRLASRTRLSVWRSHSPGEDSALRSRQLERAGR
jgi:Enoyl-(Acyl carrier protein) reductase